MFRLIGALALALGVPVAANEGPPPMPAWLAGSWETQVGDSWTDEFWTPPRGGVMIGAGRNGQGEQARFWEHTRILRKNDGSLSYFAQPRGAPSTEFVLVAQGADYIEFANAAHDFPQRIRYWRDGPLLRARVSLLDGSRAEEWAYAPLSGN